MSGLGRGAKVRFVGHPDHAAPPVLEGLEGEFVGRIVAELEGDLFRVARANDGSPFPWVQLHADQLETA